MKFFKCQNFVNYFKEFFCVEKFEENESYIDPDPF